MAVLAALLAVIAVGTSGWRASKATDFDSESAAALERTDLQTAFQKTERSAALKPTDQRLLRLASLAYLRQRYDTSAELFERAARAKNADLRKNALVGQAAAAGRAGNHRSYNIARNALGTPDGDERMALAHAAIDAGDLDTAARILKNEKGDTKTLAYAKALGMMLGEPASARQALESAGAEFNKPEYPEPAYERMVRQVVFIEADGLTELDGVAVKLAALEALPGKRVLLAQTLYGLKEYRTAERQAKAAVAEVPAYRDGWNTLAAAQLALRDFKNAERSVGIALELDESLGYTWYLRAELAKAQNDQTKAKQFRDKATGLGYSER